MSIIVALARMKARSRLRTVIVLALVATAVLCGLFRTTMAQVQTACGTRQMMLDGIAKAFGETPVAFGTSEQGQNAITFLLNVVTGTWTLLVTTTDGMTCVIHTGSDWGDHPITIFGPRA